MACLLASTGFGVRGGPLVGTECPIEFFTNVANRLLQSQLGLSLNHIQVYPTNQYTPSVHRLLQVTANLYDASTNRPITGYPYLPSVFRPVFATTTSPNGQFQVFIIDYEEVGDAMSFLSQGAPLDLSDPSDLLSLDARDDRHMIYNIPLVIGAKKGFPNFNNFAMQTLVQVTRKLQFLRQNGQNNGPISQTNQMFLVGISNAFGVEAWNSYAASFPRPLDLYVWPDISVVMTNEIGTLLNPTSSRYQPPVTYMDIGAGDWAGNDPAVQQYSFQIPLFTNLLFLTNSTYRYASGQFVPLTDTFEHISPAFYIPHWWVEVKARLRFAVVDPSVTPPRIVDYVNLADQNLVSLTDLLSQGGQCGGVYAPDGGYGSLWCTNHYPIQSDQNLPTYGVLNQILVSLAAQPLYGQAVWTISMDDFPPGMDKYSAIDSFRAQFGLGPLFTHPPNTFFYKTNVFNAPFQPVRNIYLLTSWQANDPVAHYTVSDLSDPLRSNIALDFVLFPAPMAYLGHVNYRYHPWGGNLYGYGGSFPSADLTLEDPFMLASDYWDFPTNLLCNLAGLGRVHRGTPWQTLYLKSFPVTSYGSWFTNWVAWSGDDQVVTNMGQLSTNLVPLYIPGTTIGVASDAVFAQPTNDWRLASLLVSLFNSNNPQTLASVNQPNAAAWRGLLDGITVLTNTDLGQFDPVIMSSNSAQAAAVATALDTARSTQPGQRFGDPANILATPELSTASPWLNLTSNYGVFGSPNDNAYEAIPSQLLPLLRPDSVGSVTRAGDTVQIQFTGADGYAYVVQMSSNLSDWVSVSTNYPANGSFSYVNTFPPPAAHRFYRCILWR